MFVLHPEVLKMVKIGHKCQENSLYLVINRKTVVFLLTDVDVVFFRGSNRKFYVCEDVKLPIYFSSLTG